MVIFSSHFDVIKIFNLENLKWVDDFGEKDSCGIIWGIQDDIKLPGGTIGEIRIPSYYLYTNRTVFWLVMIIHVTRGEFYDTFIDVFEFVNT